MGKALTVLCGLAAASLFLSGNGKKAGSLRVERILGRGGPGRLALLEGGKGLLLASGGRLVQYSQPEGREVFRYSGGIGDPVFLGAAEKGGKIVAVGSGGKILLWEEGRPDPLKEWDLGASSGAGKTRILHASLSPEGDRLVLTKAWFGVTAISVLNALARGVNKGGCIFESGLFQGKVQVLLLELSPGGNPFPLGKAPGEKTGPAGGFFTGEGKVLADWTPEGKLHFRSLPSLEITRTVDVGRKMEPSSFCSSPTGRRAAFFLDGGQILVLDVQAGRFSGVIQTGWTKDFDTRVAFSLDEKGIWAWKNDPGEVGLWRIKDGRKIFEFREEEIIQDVQPLRGGILVLDRAGKVLLLEPEKKEMEKVLLPAGQFWDSCDWVLDEGRGTLFFSQDHELVSLDLEEGKIEKRVSFPGRILWVTPGLDLVLWRKGEKCWVSGVRRWPSGEMKPGSSRPLSFDPQAVFPGGGGFLALDEEGRVFRLLPGQGGEIMEKEMGNLGRIPGFPQGLRFLGRARGFYGNTLFLSIPGDAKREDRLIAWKAGESGMRRLWIKKTSSNVEKSLWSLAADPEGRRVFLGMEDGKVRVLDWKDGTDLDQWVVSSGGLFHMYGNPVRFLAWIPGMGLACLAGRSFRLLDSRGRVKEEFAFPAEPDLVVPWRKGGKWIFFLSNGTVWILGSKKG